MKDKDLQEENSRLSQLNRLLFKILELTDCNERLSRSLGDANRKIEKFEEGLAECEEDLRLSKANETCLLDEMQDLREKCKELESSNPILSHPDYKIDHGDMTGWRYLNIGEMAMEGDQLWRSGEGPWIYINSTQIGMVRELGSWQVPFRRKV